MAILIVETVKHILDGFDAYRKAFREITQNARKRFETQDWHGIQKDSRDRLRLYKSQVAKVALGVRSLLQDDYRERGIWKTLKQAYAMEAAQRKDSEVAETFFNSVCRKVIGDLGANADFMFVKGEIMRRHSESVAPIFRTYPLTQPFEEIIPQIFKDYPFELPYEDPVRDQRFILDRLKKELPGPHKALPTDRLEMLRSVFFRNKAAYLVGRLIWQDRIYPFILPVLHAEKGLYVDTLIADSDTMSIIFSFTRSYFLVDVEIPAEMMRFLNSTIPKKHFAEIYNSIGFNKHGKTQLYRDFIKHLSQSEDQFVHAPGIKGMVMAVFTLPSYPIVFKLIKDHFDPPKITNKAMVKGKYRLVSRHDRVGRMADTHEFDYFEFPLERFSPELLKDLRAVAPSIVHVRGEKVIIDHLYTERRMIPLNIFLENATTEEKEEVIDEYGNTIKQLAAVNIFPGDMLLKNFGVTRHRRVVFYDYDEIGFLTDYQFREMPKAKDPYAGRPWFEVKPGDVFPEEFRHFLIGRHDMEQSFVRLHADLFGLGFWHEMQARQRRGEIVDAFPYRRRIRFRNL